MISLDDEAALRAADPSGLLDAFATLPRQLREGYELGRAVQVPGDGRPDAVVLCGMGGSAAAADAAAAMVPWSMVPIIVVRGEELPSFVNERTLVICLSYSGETDETLWAADDAAGRTRRLVCIASGGRLAKPLNGPSVVVPDVAPTPRAALGWLTGGALGVLWNSEIAFSEADETPSRRFLRGPSSSLEAMESEVPVVEDSRALEEIVSLVEPSTPRERNHAKQIAGWLADRIPVIWAATPELAAAATRWKAGFNENAKIPAFPSMLPELLHHEVVGWTEGRGSDFAVILLNGLEGGSGPSYDRQAARVRASLELLDEVGIEHMNVHLPASDVGAAALLGLMAIGDFASAYHALMRGIDPTPIEAIARIKDKLR